MRIEPDSAIPVFQQIVEGIRSAIAAGVYRPGEMIPSVRQQAVACLVNPNTVQRAYEELERQGLVASKKGSGMLVAGSAPRIATSGTERDIAAILTQAVALARDAKLERQSVDEIYRQAWKKFGKSKAEALYAAK